jgi:hypothetical protein
MSGTAAPTRKDRRSEHMNTRTARSALSSSRGFPGWRVVAYWLATAAVVGEMGLGGSWDIARLPVVADLVTHLGYPSYFLVLLGTWKVLGALALLVPRLPQLKEWAYAGAFFAYTGAIVSHLVTGYALGELGLLVPLVTLTVLSWALRPASRRLPRQTSARPPVTAHATPQLSRTTHH